MIKDILATLTLIALLYVICKMQEHFINAGF